MPRNNRSQQILVYRMHCRDKYLALIGLLNTSKYVFSMRLLSVIASDEIINHIIEMYGNRICLIYGYFSV